MMPFIDLKTQYQRIAERLEARMSAVFAHGQFVLGPEIEELEDALASYVGARHCVTVASGSDALLIALLGLDIGSGAEVITTPFSFIATAEMIALLGARPVFVDIEPRTYNIDPAGIEAAITPRTRAIMPVSLYGQCADFDAISHIAERHGLPVIEDGAQSFGAIYKGRHSCGLSTIGCTSFFPAKPLGAYGEGGACFTDDDGLAEKMRQLRNHGQDRHYHHAMLGLNGRLDTLQAAVLLAKMEIFPEEVEARARIGAYYTELIRSRCPAITPSHIEPHNTSVYAQYTLQSADRNRLRERLRQQGIPTAVHYPTPLHRQPVFQGDGAELPIAEAATEHVLSLPMHPYLSGDAQEQIVNALSKA